MAAASVQLKVEIEQKGRESRLRRITCPGDWNTVSNVLNEWAGSGYEVQYTDTDGDVVTVSSEREWQECVRISPQPPLRLRCIGGKKPRSQRGAAPPAEAAQEAPQSAPSAQQPQRGGEEESCPTEVQRDPIGGLPRTVTEGFKSAGQQLLRQLDAATSEMLSQLHSLVPQQNCSDDFTQACRHADQGNLNDAASALVRAVQAGHCTSGRITAATSLRPLRGNPHWDSWLANADAAQRLCAARCGFIVTGVHPTHCCHCCSNAGTHGAQCLRVIATEQTEAPAAATSHPAADEPATQPPEPSAPELPEQPLPQVAPAEPAPEDPAVRTILELGLCDADAARAALVACGGNVQQAVATVLTARC
eukprot:TRINITY_DN1809_c0_g1_i4.p1 TRINITY_DN1809_c0_g1~~TRINITY_DN1809_c0_g1_i4.p1  ORF type:complete len:363 (+),score=85.12 TRINITY_DN1809_c0_g1_i4:62-1150(+)